MKFSKNQLWDCCSVSHLLQQVADKPKPHRIRMQLQQVLLQQRRKIERTG